MWSSFPTGFPTGSKKSADRFCISWSKFPVIINEDSPVEPCPPSARPGIRRGTGQILFQILTWERKLPRHGPHGSSANADDDGSPENIAASDDFASSCHSRNSRVDGARQSNASRAVFGAFACVASPCSACTRVIARLRVCLLGL